MSFADAVAEAKRFGLVVSAGTVPLNLVDNPEPPRWLQVSGQQVLVRVPAQRRLLVSAGREAVVDLPETDDQDAIGDWFVTTWAIPMAMIQRGWLSLHASTVVVADTTIAIGGHSGAGKSTTTWALHGRGHPFVVDEATLCEVRDDGVLVHPYRRHVQLTQESAARLGMGRTESYPALLAPGKTAFNPGPVDTSTRPLDKLVILNPFGQEPGVQVERARPETVLPHLNQLAYRLGLSPKILGPQKYLDLLVRFAQHTDTYIVTRPAQEWSLDQVVDAVEGLAA